MNEDDTSQMQISSNEDELGIDIKMLELLVCPLTKGHLKVSVATSELISVKAKLAYPIRGRIPIMLASEARELDEDELQTI